MGITDRVSQYASQMQESLKDTSLSFFGVVLKLVTAFFLALTVSLIAQGLMGSGDFTFVFTMVLGMGLTLKLIGKWAVGSVLLFDLFCVLVALLLRLYLQAAP